MPTYDYHCMENDSIVEVKHPINEKLTTWGEVCSHSGMNLGNISADSPVSRLISGGQVVKSSTLKNPEPACSPGGCCSGGMCGM